MDILSLTIAILCLDLWNLEPRTGSTQGIQIWSQNFEIFETTVQKSGDWSFQNQKEMGSPRKNILTEFL